MKCGMLCGLVGQYELFLFYSVRESCTNKQMFFSLLCRMAHEMKVVPDRFFHIFLTFGSLAGLPTLLFFLFYCFLYFCFARRCASSATALIPSVSWCVQAAGVCCRAVAGCGVALVFLFISLCVDVLLVCAEGCTQLTGVMAMMMAGRVLLVCALCVLWCGAGGGGCSERTQVPPGGVSQGGNNPDGTNNTTDGAGGGVNSGATAKSQLSSESVTDIRVAAAGTDVSATQQHEKQAPETGGEKMKNKNGRTDEKEKKEEGEEDDEEEEEEYEVEEIHEGDDDAKKEESETKEEKKIRRRRRRKSKKMMPTPQRGCQQAVKGRQLYLLM
ncbi:hypothetical protein TCDM_10320 [Trypanosoma cruzi Dm28c]|uniref:Mucin-associated surface protein (MASP) n=1 Tax=Trypanosoma cruzi Dm28c TaxID=1416333 RepID=V5B3B5_TRYCR|nr:hypothetical protein TCDM_10320 [Trypanosoma cruzi Dm28c]